MASGNLSPRQKMINMMYLVLTALLALNVSKEVLQSFFEVNQGIERMTNSFDIKNEETYTAFNEAATANSIKAGPFNNKAKEVQVQADELVVFIQKMKYDLVFKADKGKVYLGLESEFKNDEGKLIKEKAITVPWESLTPLQQAMSIGDLNAKDDRNSSGDLFWNDKTELGIAIELKEKMISYSKFITSIEVTDSLGGPIKLSQEAKNHYQNIKNSINKVFDFEDRKIKGKKKKKQKWEKYNFYDMPAVGALTLLSKMQSDIRNAEADVIGMLKENIEASSLKFTSADAIQVPNSNFVLRGQTFEAEVFLAAKDTTQLPVITIGKTKQDENGMLIMDGPFETLPIVNGKGIYSRKSSSLGPQKWGGLIKIQTGKEQYKTYPFQGEYLVAAKSFAVSPTKMNILYVACNNPISVSVAGYTASQVSASMSGGKLSKSGKGKYIARPTKKGTAKISVYASVNGKRTNMGTQEFRVKDVPDPISYIANTKKGKISAEALSKTRISAKLVDFMFEGIKFKVTSFEIHGTNKGAPINARTSGSSFNGKMKKIIMNSRAGSTINITKIRAKRTDGAGGTKTLGDIVIKLN